MSEYGQVVGQGSQVAGSGHATGGGDLGATIGASITDALNHASATLGVPPALLLLAVVAVLLVVLYLVFAR